MKNSKFLFAVFAAAVCLYVAYKFTGKPALAIFAVIMIVIAGIYTIVYDSKHGTFPWKKTAKGKEAEMRHLIEKGKAKEEKAKKRAERTNSKTE